MSKQKAIQDLHPDIKRRNAYQVPPELITIDKKWNIRETMDKDGIEDLARNIAKVGIKVPPIVRRDGENLILVDGERRLRAVLLAKKRFGAMIKTIPVELEGRYTNEEDNLITSIIANELREDVPPLERANGYKRLMDGGYDVTEVAEMLGRTVDHVTRQLRLLEASPKVRKALKDGRISPHTVSELVRRFPDDKKKQDKALEDAIAASGGKKAKGKDVRKSASKQKTGKDPDARRRTRRVATLNKDIDVIEGGKVGNTPEGEYLDGFLSGLKYAASIEDRPSWLPAKK